jgi:hypothetical protein
MDTLPGWGKFNTAVSSSRGIVENGIGLFKMKWRRFHKHQIAELTNIIPDLIICGCVLHNICFDAGDVTHAGNNAVDDRDDEDREDIRAAFNRVFASPHACMTENADERVQEARVKKNKIFDYWISYNLNRNDPHNIVNIRDVFGDDAFLTFF